MFKVAQRIVSLKFTVLEPTYCHAIPIGLIITTGTAFSLEAFIPHLLLLRLVAEAVVLVAALEAAFLEW